MSTSLLSSQLQPSALIETTTAVTAPTERITPGWPGIEPKEPTLDICIYDDSESLSGVDGNDPVASRYKESRLALDLIARWSFTATQKIAVLHFDHPQVPALQPIPLHRGRHLRRILAALEQPGNCAGSSDLVPAMAAANRLAKNSGASQVQCTIFSDFALTDQHPAQPYEEIGKFAGPVHAVVLNATASPILTELPNVTVTEVRSDDPSGMLAAALAHSLTANRRGARAAARRRGH